MTTEEDSKEAERRAKWLEVRKRQIEDDKAAEAEYQSRADEAGAQRDEWHRRWSLRLAVANGAGLIGASTVLLNAFDELVAIGILPALLVSAWLFFLGAALAGAIPFFRSRNFEHRRGLLWTRGQEARHGGGTVPIYTEEDNEQPSSDFIEQHGNASRFWRRSTTYAEIVAALTFGLGVAGPLAILTASTFFGA